MNSPPTDISIVVFETASGSQTRQTVSAHRDIYEAVSLAPMGTVMLYFYNPQATLQAGTVREVDRSKTYFLDPKARGDQLRVDQDWRPPMFVTFDPTNHEVLTTVDYLP